MTQTPEAQAPPPAEPAGSRVPSPVPPRQPADDSAAALRDPRLTSLPADQLLVELLARLCQVMTADVAQYLLVEGDALRVMASHGVPLEQVRDLRIPVGRGFAGAVAATAQPSILPDTGALEAFGPSWADEGVRSLVGVPLVVEGRVLGVAVVGSRAGRPFDRRDVELLTAASERAAWAVEHGLLLAAERQARDSAASISERLERLRAMAQALLTDLTVAGVVRTVVDRGLSLIGAFAGAVWEVTPDGLVLRGVVGYPDEVEARWRRMPLDGDGPAPDAARLGRPVVLRSIAERDARYPALRGRASAGEAFVASPLVVDGTTIGVLGLGFDHGEHLDDEGLLFIEAAIAQCAAAMHRALVLEAQERSLAEMRETARRLRSLQRVTAALADVHGGETALDFIIREVGEATGALQVALCVLDEPAGVIRIVRSHGLGADLTESFAEFPYAPGLPAADAILRRQPVLLRTPEERDALYPNLTAQSPMEHAWATLPLVIGDNVIGALALSMPGPQAFTLTDLDFLAALADQCGHALERARLLDVESAIRRRLELLAEAGRIFAAPLDVELTSLQFARLMVGRVADAVSIHLREQNGSYPLVALDHVDPEQLLPARRLAAHLPAAVVAEYDRILDGGTSTLTADLQLEDILASVDDETREVLAQRQPRSSILLPLVAGGHKLGILSLTTIEGGRAPLGEHDLALLEELAGRLALAVDSARLLRQQTEIAHTLQRSLLPASLPQVPGAEVAVRYLPGAEGVDVGGDFYDVVPLPSGRIGLVVGDVMGRGVRAAAVMGQLRAAVRSYCLEGHSPAALLTRLDRLVGTLEEGLLVTAIYAEWDVARSTVLCSCAGHLPPLVRLPGEQPRFVDIDPGVPLGVGGHPYAEVEIALPPGSLLLAYTDGLVEGPDLPHEDGMRRLADAVTGAVHAMDVCDAALGELRPLFGSRRYDDDTALLALVTHETGAPVPAAEPVADDGTVVVELPAENASPAHARAVVTQALAAWSLPALVDTATLLVSELVTNAVRHAGTALRLTVRRKADTRVRVAVTDYAPTANVRPRQSSTDAEGGRGLFLVEHLSAGWGSVADDNGKTVWFELQA